MENIKRNIAEAISAESAEIWGEALAIPADSIPESIEYPPDTAMGDLAFPCFKLSRIFRKAPPLIASEISEKFSSSVVSKAQAVNGYLNIFVNNEYLVKNVLLEIEDKKEMNFKVQDISIYLLRNLNKLKQNMAENCSKNSNEHEYINRLDLIIKFLPANVDKTMLKEIKTSLEDDFERVSEPMPIEK